MQSLLSTARNITYQRDADGEWCAAIEAVLMTVGPHWRFDGPEIVKTQRIETVRFQLSPEAAEQFAETLKTWANDAVEGMPADTKQETTQ